MPLINRLPVCHQCGSLPIILGGPHSNWEISCSNDGCENRVFDTYREGAVRSWIGQNCSPANEYLQADLRWDRFKKGLIELDEDLHLCKMDSLWWKMTSEERIYINLLGEIGYG